MDANGADPVDLTNSPEIDFEADWAPDGSRLVFTRQVPGIEISTQLDIFVMNADGSGQVDIMNSDTDELDPAWSPDGDRLAFAAVRGADFEMRWEIATSDPNGQNETVITGTGPSYEDRSPDWAPNGDMIVWMSQLDESCCGDWDVWAMNEEGSGKTNLTDDGDPWIGFGDWYPSWSPDGTQVTFSSNRGTGWSFDVYAMDAPTQLPPAAAAGTVPAASGDGARLVIEGSNATGLSWGPATTAAVTVMFRGSGSGNVSSTDGSLRCRTTCAGSFALGSQITLRAKASTGSTFMGWTGPCTGLSSRCTLTASATTRVGASFVPASAAQ